MSEFFFWFIRPIAEMLGVVVLLALSAGAFYGYLVFEDWRNKRKPK